MFTGGLSVIDSSHAPACKTQHIDREDPAPRSGMARRYYRVEPEGFEALNETRDALQRMWSGLEPMLGKL